ncbi:hypothetical protein [Salinarchaeum laminariae]|uniref:hypothetical protein n=1 Tax=Salinarchaeum laminariae TaxID=869888 RepID=UPI0020BEEC91|nr:hypothetical protein [Salinarchaeum laminariae]
MIATGAASIGSLVGTGSTYGQEATVSEVDGRGNPQSSPGDDETKFLDAVYFGDEDSEGDRVSATDAPAVEGALETSARAVAGDGGTIEVSLQCDPTEETLFTVRMWGGDPSATKLRFAVDGESISTQASVDSPELPGRFFYETVLIPTDHTEGQERVTVTITADSDDASHAYSAYTHVENFYAPPRAEVQGSPLERPEPSEPNFDRMSSNLLEAFDEGVDRQKDRQNYDDPTNRAYGLASVGSRGWPKAAGNFVRAYQLEESRHYGDEELVDRALAVFDGHCRYQGYRGTLEIFWGITPWLGGPDRSGIGGGLPGFMATNLARSFAELQPILEERPELLDEEIDNNADGEKSVTRREAYTQFWRDYLWENMLPRFGIAQKVFNQIIVNGVSMVRANEILKFLSPEDAAPDDLILKQMRAKAGILPIDDDVVDFSLELQTRNAGEYGQAPGTIEDGRYYESQHWHWSASRHYNSITPDGISMEFGYDPGYGYAAFHHFEAATEFLDDPQINDQFRTFMDGFQHVLYPTLSQNGERWGKVAAIGSRNPGNPWKGIGVQGVGNPILAYVLAAVDMDHEPSKRVVREHFRYHDDFEGGFESPSPAHLYRLLTKLPDLEDWWEQTEPTDYRLPTEREGAAAWVDEMAGLSMIDDEEGTHYLFGWATTKGEGEWANQPTYHRITDEYRAFGDAKTDFCPGSHVGSTTVGPYEVAVNASNHRDVRVEGGPRVHVPGIDSPGKGNGSSGNGHPGKGNGPSGNGPPGRGNGSSGKGNGPLLDLVSGEGKMASNDQILDAGDSLVLDRRQHASPTNPGPQPKLQRSSVDSATRRKHWSWRIRGNDDGAEVHSLPLDESDETAQVATYYEDAATLGTGQHSNQVPTFYRPDEVGDRNPVTVSTEDDEELAVETIDGCVNRLVVETPDSGAREIEATAILPTFDSYDAWDVDTPGFSGATVRTDDALEVSVDEEQEVTHDEPVTFALPLNAPVERIVFTHESNWDTTSDLRMVLETSEGEVLWEGTRPEDVVSPEGWDYTAPTDEMVNLEEEHVEDELYFRVVNTAPEESGEDTWYRSMTAGGKANEAGPTSVDSDWFRRILDVRIEYADGTARYPNS